MKPYEAKYSTEVSTMKTWYFSTPAVFKTSKNVSIIFMDNVTLIGVSYQQNSAIHCVSEFGVTAINVHI